MKRRRFEGKIIFLSVLENKSRTRSNNLSNGE